MAKITLKPSSNWEALEEGIYVAEVARVEVVEHAADNYHEEPYNQLKWAFRLHIPDRDDKPWFSTWTSMSLNAKSKLPKLLDAFGVPYTSDSFDPEDAVGKFGRLNITEYTKADKTTGNKVLSYSAYKGKPLQSALDSNAQPAAAGSRINSERAPKRPAAEEVDEGDIPF